MVPYQFIFHLHVLPVSRKLIWNFKFLQLTTSQFPTGDFRFYDLESKIRNYVYFSSHTTFLFIFSTKALTATKGSFTGSHMKNHFPLSCSRFHITRMCSISIKPYMGHKAFNFTIYGNVCFSMLSYFPFSYSLSYIFLDKCGTAFLCYGLMVRLRKDIGEHYKVMFRIEIISDITYGKWNYYPIFLWFLCCLNQFHLNVLTF